MFVRQLLTQMRNFESCPDRWCELVLFFPDVARLGNCKRSSNSLGKYKRFRIVESPKMVSMKYFECSSLESHPSQSYTNTYCTNMSFACESSPHPRAAHVGMSSLAELRDALKFTQLQTPEPKLLWRKLGDLECGERISSRRTEFWECSCWISRDWTNPRP